MPAGWIVKLRPQGPWRSGPDSGARNRVDPVFHSDSLFAAVTSAMAALDSREEWLEATARNAAGSAVRFSSCFPFQGGTLLVTPPRSLWPPAAGAVSAGKVRWKGARFVPVTVVSALLGGQPLQEDSWTIDGPSECLVPTGQAGPFRMAMRSNAAVDRLTGSAERHSTACMEFRRDAGLWAAVAFADDAARARWSDAVRGAFRLLADSGLGGERSRGWGRSAEPEFIEGALDQLILGEMPAAPAAEEAGNGEPAAPVESGATLHWLLSLFTAAAADAVDWQRGSYTLVTRGGRVESNAGFGERKKQLQMVTEGSVLAAGDDLRGAAPDVAPDGFAHPVFRAGFALSLALPAASPAPVREREGAPA